LQRFLQVRVVLVARADERALWTVCRRVVAGALVALPSAPSVRARARAVHGVAGAAVDAVASLAAAQAELTVRTLLLALKVRAEAGY
jgi:hypothetical protein